MRHHLLSLVLTFLCSGFSAQAQQVGKYEGTTDDGSSVFIQVAQDPSNENLEVNVVSFGLSMPCSKSGETLHDIGIGVGNGYDIIDGKFSYTTADFYGVDLVTSMTFHGQNTVKGKVSGGLAAYNPASGHNKPTKSVQACTSPKQNFTATFTGTRAHYIPAGTVTVRKQPVLVRH